MMTARKSKGITVKQLINQLQDYDDDFYVISSTFDNLPETISVEGSLKMVTKNYEEYFGKGHYSKSGIEEYSRDNEEEFCEVDCVILF